MSIGMFSVTVSSVPPKAASAITSFTITTPTTKTTRAIIVPITVPMSILLSPLSNFAVGVFKF